MLLFTRALLAAAVLSGAACNVYDDSNLSYANAGAGAGAGAGAEKDAGLTKDACTPQTEICNGRDDDCDGASDEAKAVALDCASRLLNAQSTCQSAFCVKIGECFDGFHNCDGMPDNGCESACPCGRLSCDAEDAGA
jgi:hypothetical protein